MLQSLSYYGGNCVIVICYSSSGYFSNKITLPATFGSTTVFPSANLAFIIVSSPRMKEKFELRKLTYVTTKHLLVGLYLIELTLPSQVISAVPHKPAIWILFNNPPRVFPFFETCSTFNFIPVHFFIINTTIHHTFGI